MFPFDVQIVGAEAFPARLSIFEYLHFFFCDTVQ